MGLFQVCIFIPLLCMASCTLGKGGVLSANVNIIVLPYGKGSVLQPRVPRLAYSAESEDLACRPEQPNLQNIRDIAQLKVISKLLLGDEEEGDEENQQEGRDEPVNVSVQGGWIKLGFLVSNNNSGEGQAYVLRVDRLEFHGNGNCEQYGQPPCVFHQTITDYCDLPFVYLVTPGEAAHYKPVDVNPLENLTIYVDQIPVIDAATLPARDNKLPGGATLILPQYTVEVLFVGEFLLEDGTALQPFRKRISFTTNRSQSF